ncbi:hypothetical protein OS121_29400 [Mycolicibacterium mucogenicum]|jgi:hypothetical protein|uniref:hypothetical protein n=1 Tax=Mycolicibacterium mucogenicum TaxID=56689 RepID=UPI00076A0460|nr:hypothetical protein [Mycolicibacterium mucogenicum]MCX8559164.1 hypothetical protein [Mycolicibacterium mucogenicum]
MSPSSGSDDTDWVETFLPLIVLAMIGAAIYFQRAVIIGWLAAHHILTRPPQQPLIPVYAGYGIDLQRLLLLLVPAVAAVISAVAVGLVVHRNLSAQRKPQ